MNIFQHAAFWPFEVVFIDKAIQLHAPIFVDVFILVIGLVYARFFASYLAGVYNSFPPTLQIASVRIPFIIALVMIPIGAEKMIEGCFNICDKLIGFVV